MQSWNPIQHISVPILAKDLLDVLEVVLQFLHIQRVVFVFVAPLKKFVYLGLATLTISIKVAVICWGLASVMNYSSGKDSFGHSGKFGWVWDQVRFEFESAFTFESTAVRLTKVLPGVFTRTFSWVDECQPPKLLD